MRAVILAAGRGGRLSGVVGDRPKCLARVGDTTLIERQIHMLREHGINDIAVVAGYGALDVRRVCGAGVDIVLNTRYTATNSLYSLWLTRDLLSEGFIVMNCDLLIHPQILTDLLTSRLDDALVVADRRDAASYSDEEMKVHIRRGLVRAISKTLADEDADGENVGMGRFSSAGAAALVDHLNDFVAMGAVRDWLPRAFDAFCRTRPLHAVGTRGFPWIEIDFPEDYWQACSDILPAIDADGGRRGSPRSAAAGDRRRAGRTTHHV